MKIKFTRLTGIVALAGLCSMSTMAQNTFKPLEKPAIIIHSLLDKDGKQSLHNAENRPETIALRAGTKRYLDSLVFFLPSGQYKDKYIYSNDANGNNVLTEHFVWENNQWVNDRKYMFANDANGNLILDETYRRDGNQWVNQSKYVYTYDANGNRTLAEYYNGAGNQWVNSSKYVYTYDANGNRTLEEFYRGDGNQWVNSSKYVYAYENQKRISGDYYFWKVNYSLEENYWVHSKKYTYTYDAKGNLTLEESLRDDDAGWQNDRRTTYKYDANDKQILRESEQWNDSEWVNYDKYVFAYDTNGNRTLEEHYRGDGDQWAKISKIVHEYDANGNLILNEFYGGDDNQWVKKYKYVNEYDADGYRILEEYNNENGEKEWYSIYYSSVNNTTGNAIIGTEAPAVYINQNTLFIQSCNAEKIAVYAINGALLYQAQIREGMASLDACNLPGGVLIVKGSSGWVKKVMK